MAQLYVAYIHNGRHPQFYSLPMADRQAAIAACFEAFPSTRTVISCKFFNGFVTGSDMRWHDRWHWSDH